MSSGVGPDALPRDTESNDWGIINDRSFVLCDDIGDCSFNIYFVREFNTEDPDDYELYPNHDQLFKTISYYNGGGQVAQSDEIYIELGANKLLYSASSLLVAAAILLQF